MQRPTAIFLVLILQVVPSSNAEPIKVTETDEYVEIETDAIQARVRKKGYVSGIERGTFLDKKTGARDVGFGSHIMDFLMAPGWRDDGYLRNVKVHGDLPKHYVEGPQICTKARELPIEIVEGRDFVALKLRFKFHKPGTGYQAGSTWEQTLVFQPKVRYVLSSELITSANDVDDLFYRIDMPGHLKHNKGDTFHQIYLSYRNKPIPSDAFNKNSGPDEKHLYQRKRGGVPERMIRAYQVMHKGKPGPWMAGMTLDPAAVSEAWCHQRGYVCFIQELHRRKVKKGEEFGAAYVVGWFDGVKEMETIYDQHKGATRIAVDKHKFALKK